MARRGRHAATLVRRFAPTRPTRLCGGSPCCVSRSSCDLAPAQVWARLLDDACICVRSPPCTLRHRSTTAPPATSAPAGPAPSMPPTQRTPTGSAGAGTTETAYRRVDQRPIPRSTHTEQLTTNCLRLIDRFRSIDHPTPKLRAGQMKPQSGATLGVADLAESAQGYTPKPHS